MFQWRQSFLLFLTATIWGSGFVAQAIGMDYVTPFTYTFFRTLLGGLFLLPILLYFKQRAAKKEKITTAPVLTAQHSRKDLFIGSVCCGLCLIGGESFQQYGLVTTEAGKAGFITSMYVIFVPLLGLFLGKKLNIGIVTGVVLSLIGMYLLCIHQDVSIEKGDLLILIAAVIFSCHILTIDHFVEKCDGVELSCGQFFAASFMALILMIVVDYDAFSWEHVYLALPAILWSGIMSNGVAYTLQVVGQKGMHPTIATLILSLESVMAVVFGTLLLDESMTARESLGCSLILLAVIVAQVNIKTLLKRWKKAE